MSAAYPRVVRSELGSCPRCRRLVIAYRLGGTAFAWDVPGRDIEDYTRLVGSAVAGRQGFGRPLGPADPPAHDCGRPARELTT